MQISDNVRGALYMNVAMAAFTLNDACMKAVAQSLPLFEAVALRGLISIPLLFLVGALTGGLMLRLPRRDARIVSIRALAEVGATITFLTALIHLPLANLSAIMQSTPLAVTLAAALFLREPVGWRRMLAISIGFCGVLIIIRPGGSGFDGWGMLGLASVCCVVLRDLSTRQLSRAVPSVTVALWSSVVITGMGLVGATVGGWQPATLAHMAVLALSAGTMVVGYLFVIMVMRVGDISFVAPFRYTALLWAILLGWLVFGSLPDLWTVVGSAIVVATGLFTLYRESRLRAAKA
ncbi:DMT family transporter [Cereibacter changlensis]|uniref:DMT family transporter n=1 Tax=Cereibacter changlensis TaxID=402884 RepID=UPI004033C6FF